MGWGSGFGVSCLGLLVLLMDTLQYRIAGSCPAAVPCLVADSIGAKKDHSRDWRTSFEGPQTVSLQEHGPEVRAVMTTRLMPTTPHRKHKALVLHRGLR